jgi:hypothetical protein
METHIEIMGAIVHMAHRENGGKGGNDTYDSESIVARARSAPGVPKCDEHVLNVLLGHLRMEGLKANGPFDPQQHVYGAPVLVVLDNEFNVVHKRPWSRTFHDLLELTEVAKTLDGALLVEQDVEWLMPGTDEAWCDEGFSVEVWPRLRVRPTNI